MKKGISVACFVASALLCSCTGDRTPVSPQDYLAYAEAEENGLRKQVAVGPLIYDFQYKPAAYIALRELGPQGQPGQLAKRVRELQHTVWFNVRILTADRTANPLKRGASGLEEYEQRLSYFLTEVASAWHLTYGDHDADRIGYHFENNYGLTPDDVMIVGFRIPDSVAREPLRLEYEDLLYSSGIVKITIDKRDLASIPAIAI